ncbi:MAG: hypothetical protein P1U74_06940 [Legionellaceae bacterium]|nr:hypothetical protein [Legionellaceae bacterium]
MIKYTLNSISNAVRSKEFENKILAIEKLSNPECYEALMVMIMVAMILALVIMAHVGALSLPIAFAFIGISFVMAITCCINRIFIAPSIAIDIKKYNKLIDSFDKVIDPILPRLACNVQLYVNHEHAPDLFWLPASKAQSKSQVISKFSAKNDEDVSLSDLVDEQYRLAMSS